MAEPKMGIQPVKKPNPNPKMTIPERPLQGGYKSPAQFHQMHEDHLKHIAHLIHMNRVRNGNAKGQPARPQPRGPKMGIQSALARRMKVKPNRAPLS